MGALSPHVRPLAIFTSYICAIEAVAWFVITLLGIIGYADCELWDPNSVFLTSLQQIYFQDPATCNTSISSWDWYDNIMDSGDMLAWNIIMVTLNSLWFFASLIFLAGWEASKLQRFRGLATGIWCFITACICVMDTVACAMFGADYGTIYKMHPTTDPTYLAPSAMIMTLSARGFTLWFFNFGMLIYFTAYLPRIARTSKHAARKNTNEATPLDLYGPPAPGYDAFNEGFVREVHQTQQHTVPKRGPSATAQLTAGYPRTAPGQHIPRPDYSPPLDARHLHHSEPQLRSALKNKY